MRLGSSGVLAPPEPSLLDLREDKELKEIAMGDKTLRKAFHHWEELSMTPEQFLAFETRLKHSMGEEAANRRFRN